MIEAPTQSTDLRRPVAGVPGAFSIEVAELPDHLPGGRKIGPYTEAAPNALLFEVPGIARYLIRDGLTIEVQPKPDADPDAVALFLHDSARGVLIHQRGELALNGTTLVAPNWTCVALCGPSGVGKSTLAAALSRRGWLLLADAVTRVSWNGMAAIAWPSDESLKLWRDACEKFGWQGGLTRTRQGLERYSVPRPPARTPAALSAVVRMRAGTKVESLEFLNDDKQALLSECTFKERQLDALGMRSRHARMLAQVARTVRTFGLTGARECPIEELTDMLATRIA